MRRYFRSGLAAAVIVVAALSLPRMASTRGEDAPARELLIVARNMAYYVDGGDEPNPTLPFKAGEQIRLTFRSEDAGMQHDFAIAAWQVATDTLDGKGEQVVVFQVPRRSGTGASTYSCTPHAAMMNGRVLVE